MLFWSLNVPPVLAWNATGHKIIASIAFRQLTDAEQAKVIGILQRHPRYTEDFADEMPEEVRGAGEAAKNEWLFQQAAVWSDTIRSGPPEKRAFNRSEWHYINLPLFLTDAAGTELAGLLTTNVATDPPVDASLDTARMNIVQVIRFARRELAGEHAAPGDRAVLLAWLFHNVGDIHQPLHSTALFSSRLFRDGDRGGNSVKTSQAGNLHALWDQFPGRDIDFRSARNKAIGYVNNPDTAALGHEASLLLDEKAWLTESHPLAREVVYDDEVLAALRKMEAAEGAVQEFAVSEEYLKKGGRLAERRIVQAGYRLGTVLKKTVAP